MTADVRQALPLRALRDRWQRIAARERRLVASAAALLLLIAVWSTAIAPALRALRATPAQLEQLDSELLRMRAFAAEAATLRDAAPVTASQAATALHAASGRLGSAVKLAVQGDRATLQLNGVEAPALQAWLAEARSAARARPVEMQLMRGLQGWSGSLVVAVGGGG